MTSIYPVPNMKMIRQKNKSYYCEPTFREQKHGRQSAILNVIHGEITDDLHFDLYLSCTTYKADRIKTEAVIARQRKCYAQQKLLKIRVNIWPTYQGHFEMSPGLCRPPTHGLRESTLESSSQRFVFPEMVRSWGALSGTNMAANRPSWK